MKKYILVDRLRKDNNECMTSTGATSKAMSDIYTIAIMCGYKPIYIFRYSEKSGLLITSLNQLMTLFSWMRISIQIKKDDVLLMQCPIHRRHTGRRRFQKIINKKAHVVSLIHDIEELRNLESFTTYDSKEFSLTLRESEFFIVHNKSMKKYFIDKGIEPNRIVCLEVFDYLMKEGKSNREGNLGNKRVAIAGNCSIKKSGYIYKLGNLDVDIELYGNNFQTNISNPRLHYNGIVDSNILPEVIQGEFGLVWDGDNLDSCSGNTGNYLRYNNPHKISLYIAAGLPVIIWKKAALAEFVEQEGIGMAVNSLNELPELLRSMTSKDYSTMLDNVHIVSERVKTGFYTKTALGKIDDFILS